MLAAYKPELTDAGFDFVTDRQPLEGAEQALYSVPGGDLFSVFVLGPDAFAGPDLESAAPLVPDGKTIVVLLEHPQ